MDRTIMRYVPVAPVAFSRALTRCRNARQSTRSTCRPEGDPSTGKSAAAGHFVSTSRTRNPRNLHRQRSSCGASPAPGLTRASVGLLATALRLAPRGTRFLRTRSYEDQRTNENVVAERGYETVSPLDSGSFERTNSASRSEHSPSRAKRGFAPCGIDRHAAFSPTSGIPEAAPNFGPVTP